MKPQNKSWGGFEKFKPVLDGVPRHEDCMSFRYVESGKTKTVTLLPKMSVLEIAQYKLSHGAKLNQREVCALAREASRGNDVVRKEASK